ncbi:hypothetical protein [Arthrobacter sp. MYb224]|nr:hypothetical protein [Arthrobacter sp. MYb224]
MKPWLSVEEQIDRLIGHYGNPQNAPGQRNVGLVLALDHSRDENALAVEL